jgi:hypothetical protein
LGSLKFEGEMRGGKTYARTVIYKERNGIDYIADESPWREVTEEEPYKELNEKLNNEMQKWQLLGVHPAQVVKIDGLLLETKFESLVKILISSGIIENEDALMIAFKEYFISKLESYREQVKEAKLMSKPPIFKPNGDIFQ